MTTLRPLLFNVLLASLVTLAMASPARADHPDNPRGQVRLELAFGTSHSPEYSLLGTTLEADALSISPRFQFEYRVIEPLQLWLDVPMAHVAVDATGDALDDDAFRIANLAFGGRWVGEVTRQSLLRVGIGFAVPTASVPDPDDGQLIALAAYGAALATHGLWDAWLYLPERFSMIVDVQYVGRFGHAKVVASLAIAPMIPTGDQDDVEVAVQTMIGGAFANEFVEFGATFNVATFPTYDDSDEDAAQLSLQPYGRFTIGPGFLDVRFILNLDEPAGFSFDDNRWWGLHVGGGVVFD